jgi:excisionase family DNA binding protein
MPELRTGRDHGSPGPEALVRTDSKTDPEPRLLRLKPAARYLSVSVRTLRREIQAGHIPYIQLNHHAPWLVAVSDLEQWIERSRNDFR